MYGFKGQHNYLSVKPETTGMIIIIIIWEWELILFGKQFKYHKNIFLFFLQSVSRGKEKENHCWSCVKWLKALYFLTLKMYLILQGSKIPHDIIVAINCWFS